MSQERKEHPESNHVETLTEKSKANEFRSALNDLQSQLVGLCDPFKDLQPSVNSEFVQLKDIEGNSK